MSSFASDDAELDISGAQAPQGRITVKGDLTRFDSQGKLGIDALRGRGGLPGRDCTGMLTIPSSKSAIPCGILVESTVILAHSQKLYLPPTGDFCAPTKLQ